MIRKIVILAIIGAIVGTGALIAQSVKSTVSYGQDLPSIQDLQHQKEMLRDTPLVEYFERMGHGGKVTMTKLSRVETNSLIPLVNVVAPEFIKHIVRR